MNLALTQPEVIHYLQWGGLALAALVLLFLLGAVIALIGLGTQWARKQFLLADAALSPLGQTPIGGLVHSAVAELKSGVDDITDPYVQAVHGVLQTVVSGVVQAVLPQYIERAKELVTPEQVQRFLLYMVTGIEELTDGEVATEDDIPTMSYGVPEPDTPVSMVPDQEHIPAGPNEATK